MGTEREERQRWRGALRVEVRAHRARKALDCDWLRLAAMTVAGLSPLSATRPPHGAPACQISPHRALVARPRHGTATATQMLASLSSPHIPFFLFISPLSGPSDISLSTFVAVAAIPVAARILRSHAPTTRCVGLARSGSFIDLSIANEDFVSAPGNINVPHKIGGVRQGIPTRNADASQGQLRQLASRSPAHLPSASKLAATKTTAPSACHDRP